MNVLSSRREPVRRKCRSSKESWKSWKSLERKKKHRDAKCRLSGRPESVSKLLKWPAWRKKEKLGVK